MDMEIENSSELLGAMNAMRLQAQDQARRDRIAQPNKGSIRDSSARRRDSLSTKLIMGSTEKCDLSSAIVATNVVRVAT